MFISDDACMHAHFSISKTEGKKKKKKSLLTAIKIKKNYCYDNSKFSKRG